MFFSPGVNVEKPHQQEGNVDFKRYPYIAGFPHMMHMIHHMIHIHMIHTYDTPVLTLHSTLTLGIYLFFQSVIEYLKK